MTEILIHPQVNSPIYFYLSLQWLTVAAWKIPTMVKWISLIPHLSQQPTICVIWDTLSMETALALVKLMENGLETHLHVNVSGGNTFAFTSNHFSTLCVWLTIK